MLIANWIYEYVIEFYFGDINLGVENANVITKRDPKTVRADGESVVSRSQILQY
jgi:hypothetical protein